MGSFSSDNFNLVQSTLDEVFLENYAQKNLTTVAMMSGKFTSMEKYLLILYLLNSKEPLIINT